MNDRYLKHKHVFIAISNAFDIYYMTNINVFLPSQYNVLNIHQKKSVLNHEDMYEY